MIQINHLMVHNLIMDHKTVGSYCLSMPGAILDYPFGESVAVYKIVQIDNDFQSVDSGKLGWREIPSSPDRLTTAATNFSSLDVPSDTFPLDKTVFARADSPWERGVSHKSSKMFALIPEDKTPLRISLKCTPELSVILREKYETVVGGYHLNKKHWNTIILTGQLPWEEVQGLIRHSYQLVAGLEEPG